LLLSKKNSSAPTVCWQSRHIKSGMLKTLSLGELLRADYGGGVCLISGSYMFVEAGTGRPLRYPETQANESGGTVQNGTEAPVLTPKVTEQSPSTNSWARVFMSAMVSWSPTATSSNPGRPTHARKP